MKNSLKYTAIVLLLAQVAGLIYILSCWARADGSWSELGWAFLGWMVLFWYIGLILFTSRVLRKGNAASRRNDRALLIVIGIITFFSVMVTFGGIS